MITRSQVPRSRLTWLLLAATLCSFSTSLIFPRARGEAATLIRAGQIALSDAFNFSGDLTGKYLEYIRYVDASNSQGWAGSDIGAWINSAYCGLPVEVPLHNLRFPE